MTFFKDIDWTEVNETKNKNPVTIQSPATIIFCLIGTVDILEQLIISDSVDFPVFQ